MHIRVRRAARRRGFTLLEAAAALVVIGISSAAALGAVASEMRAATRVRHALTAESLAEQRLAVLRLLPREQLLSLPDSLARGVFPVPLNEYHWRATAALVRGSQDLFMFRLVVEWSGGAHVLSTHHYNPRPHLRGR